MSFWTRLEKYGKGFAFEAGQIKVGPNDKDNFVFRGGKAQEVLVNLALDFEQTIKQIRSDTLLSEQGQAQKIKKAAEDVLQEIEKLSERTLKVLKELLTKAQEEFAPPQPAEENIVTVLREIETRAELRLLPEENLTPLFQSAIKGRNEILFNAFANAPSFSPLLNEKTIQLGQRIWNEGRDPAKAKNLQEIKDVHSVVKASFEETQQAIRERGGLVDDSMRSRLEQITSEKATK